MSYEMNKEWGTVEVLDERGALIAGLEDDGLGTIVVSYGSGFCCTRRFRSIEAAKGWIEKNAGDLADPEIRDQL